MADDHVIRVTLPPDAAVQGADKIVGGVARTETAAVNAQKAFRGLGDVFKSIGAYQAQVARDAAKAAGAVDSLASSFAGMAAAMRGQALQQTAAGFRSVAEAIKLEQQMLKSIHGDLEQYKLDIAAIDALHRRGEISAKQHAAALASSRSRNGVANPMDAVSLPSVPQRSSVGSIAMGAAPTLAAAGFVGKSVIDLSDSYTSLENRLRQVAGSQANLNTLMERTRSVADNTRSDWSSTAEAYVRLKNATKDMGLSQERALKITETLNMALQSSGASASEAAAGTLQLMQGLASGALQGDEFRSIAEQLPDLLDIFAKQMGVSRGELKKLGAEGKITADVVVKSLEAASGTIRDKFAASTATAAQQWTVLKNQAMETAHDFVENSNAIGLVSSGLSTLSSGLSVVGKGMGALKTAAGYLGDAFNLIVSPGKLVVDGLKEMASGGTGAVSNVMRGMEQLGVSTGGATESFDEMIGRLSALHSTLTTGGIVSVEQFTDRMRQLHHELGGTDLISSIDEFAERMSNLHTQLSKPFNVKGLGGLLINGVGDAFGRIEGAVSSRLSWGSDAGAKKFADDLKRQVDLVERVNAPLKSYKLGIEAASNAFTAGAITQADYNDEVKRLDLELERATKRASGFQKALKGNREEIERTRLALFEKGTWKPESNNAQWAIEKARRDYDTDIEMRMDALGMLRPDGPNLEADLASHRGGKNPWEAGGGAGVGGERTRLTSAWFAELERSRQEGALVTQSLSQGFGEFAEQIAQMAASGSASFEQMVTSMAASLLQLFATQAFQSLGNLLFGGSFGGGSSLPGLAPGEFGSSLPGFATGAYIPPGGSGGTDSQVVAFRKSPWESVHINTPSQEAAMRSGGSGGGSQAINVFVGEGNIVRTLEGPGGRSTILRVVTDAFPHLRAPSGRG